MKLRAINNIITIPPLGQGFGSPYHRAALMIPPGDLNATNPFFLMADDQFIEAGPVGEAHPHAGLETVTFIVRGEMSDSSCVLNEGDVEWMTAGSGIVHSENAHTSKDLRLFQLWLVLPEAERNAEPRVQLLRRSSMPVHRGDGVVATVYSGNIGATQAATINAVPITLADIKLEPGAEFALTLPESYNGFLIVIDGDLSAGAASTALKAGLIGWTKPVGDPVVNSEESQLSLKAGTEGARVLLYSGVPQNFEVVAQGPFLAGSVEELNKYMANYSQGLFPHADSMRHTETK